ASRCSCMASPRRTWTRRTSKRRCGASRAAMWPSSSTPTSTRMRTTTRGRPEMDTTEHTAPAVTDPERQFVGCLLSLPLSEVRPVLAGMQADDLASPTCGYVLQLVIELAADGTPPAPVAVYSHAISTGRAGGEHDRHRLSLWLAETYQTAQVPLLASYLKTVVLEAAWR